MQTPLSIDKSFKQFFSNNKKSFLNKKALVIIPDNTRNYHPKVILPPIVKYLKEISGKVDFIIALGLHKKLSNAELRDSLGKRFVKENKISQHSLGKVKFLGRVRYIPLYLNKNMLPHDVIFTVGVVEPHLYSGFSGGVKCIGIGLAGKKTILTTHSVKYLSKKGVGLVNIRNNPFYDFLWEVVKKIKIPIYSLNIVNIRNVFQPKWKVSSGSTQRTLSRLAWKTFLGEARPSFLDAVSYAKKAFSYKVKGKLDCVFINCDPPKDKSLYQVTRLFNYALDKKPVVKKGGVIFVFARLGAETKGKAERNFETALKRKNLPRRYKFKKPGEHRAFKVIEASQYATLGIITANVPKGKFAHILFFKNYKSALSWAKEKLGRDIKTGAISSGFSFIPR